MAEEDHINAILLTYELSDTVKEKVEQRARRIISEQGINSFNGQYDIIAELIENRNFSRDVRLDSLITESSRNSFHEIIGKEDSNLTNSFQENEKEEGTPAPVLVDHLRDKLDPMFVQFLDQLVEEDGDAIQLEQSVKEIDDLLPEIERKLEFLAQDYTLNDQIVIPQRPIEGVDFDSAEIIQFARTRRNFEGNPLRYFQEHYEKYKGLSRFQLHKTDKKLYEALLRANQIAEAIPFVINPGQKSEDKRNFNRNPVQYFRDHYLRDYAGLTRMQLKRKDPRLYRFLLKYGQLDESIPTKDYRFGGDPVQYYKDHYVGLTGPELKRRDGSLYRMLRYLGKLGEAIPSAAPAKRFGERIGDDPLRYFREHYEERYKGMNRRQLEIKDKQLYFALLGAGQMEEAISFVLKKRSRKIIVVPAAILNKDLFRNYSNPLVYYQDHQELHGKGRKELEKIDSPLYTALLRTGGIEAVPKAKTGRKPRIDGNPVQYFLQHYAERNISRTELFKIDNALYKVLQKAGKMEEAIPYDGRGRKK